jgi:hypothetical protein
VTRVSEGSQRGCGTKDAEDFLLPWKLSAHLRMGFFLHEFIVQMTGFTTKGYNALN